MVLKLGTMMVFCGFWFVDMATADRIESSILFVVGTGGGMREEKRTRELRRSEFHDVVDVM